MIYSSPTPAYSGNPSTNRIDWYSGQYGINMIGKTAEMELLSISNASVKCNALFGFIGVTEDESIIEKLTVSNDCVFLILIVYVGLFSYCF